MYKTLALAILLLPTLTVAQEAKPAPAPVPLTTPQIVAKGKLVNQTAPIPTTTIFTPTQTGLYRLSIYGTTTKADPSSQSSWGLNLFWSDDAGAEENGGIIFGYGCCQQQWFSYSQSGLGGVTFPFEAKAGTAITYSVNQGVPDSSAYLIYYTLERLE